MKNINITLEDKTVEELKTYAMTMVPIGSYQEIDFSVIHLLSKKKEGEKTYEINIIIPYV